MEPRQVRVIIDGDHPDLARVFLDALAPPGWNMVGVQAEVLANGQHRLTAGYEEAAPPKEG